MANDNDPVAGRSVEYREPINAGGMVGRQEFDAEKWQREEEEELERDPLLRFIYSLDQRPGYRNGMMAFTHVVARLASYGIEFDTAEGLDAALAEKLGQRDTKAPNLPTGATEVDWPPEAIERFHARTAERQAEPSATTDEVLATLDRLDDDAFGQRDTKPEKSEREKELAAIELLVSRGHTVCGHMPAGRPMPVITAESTDAPGSATVFVDITNTTKPIDTAAMVYLRAVEQAREGE